MLLVLSAVHMTNTTTSLGARATVRCGICTRPQGQAPRGFENWDAEAGISRDDSGMAVPSKAKLEQLRIQRKRENERLKRQAKGKAQTMGAMRAKGAPATCASNYQRVAACSERPPI